MLKRIRVWIECCFLRGPKSRVCEPSCMPANQQFSPSWRHDTICTVRSAFPHYSRKPMHINPLNAELNPFSHLLALLGAHHIFHVSKVSVKLLGDYLRWRGKEARGGGVSHYCVSVNRTNNTRGQATMGGLLARGLGGSEKTVTVINN